MSPLHGRKKGSQSADFSDIQPRDIAPPSDQVDEEQFNDVSNNTYKQTEHKRQKQKAFNPQDDDCDRVSKNNSCKNSLDNINNVTYHPLDAGIHAHRAADNFENRTISSLNDKEPCYQNAFPTKTCINEEENHSTAEPEREVTLKREEIPLLNPTIPPAVKERRTSQTFACSDDIIADASARHRDIPSIVFSAEDSAMTRQEKDEVPVTDKKLEKASVEGIPFDEKKFLASYQPSSCPDTYLVPKLSQEANRLTIKENLETNQIGEENPLPRPTIGPVSSNQTPAIPVITPGKAHEGSLLILNKSETGLDLSKTESHNSQAQNDFTPVWVLCKYVANSKFSSTFYLSAIGDSEASVKSVWQQLTKNFNTIRPYYRSRHCPISIKVEFRGFIKAKKGAKLKKIFSDIIFFQNPQRPTETRATEGALVHEETFTEYPQFVEVTQPPTRRNPSDVEADGAISDVANDPPGQQSVYIPPGDSRREGYRLSTFESFPRSTPVNVPELARHGFYFTGYFDRVKCYSCGRTVEKWEIGDKPSDKRWHKQDCMLARGLGHDNVPIGGLFSARMTNGNLYNNSAPQPMDVGPSQAQHFNGQVSRRSNDVTDLTRSGGTFQIQPGSTYVIGSPAARQTPSATSTPNNPPSAGSNPPRGWRMANVISADHKRHLTNLYLNREIDRLASFSRWPTGRPNVAPVALARAGFFYLGDMDRTQCFSCGGVLRNWNYEDDAMDEHRTHFANCRLVVGVERRNVPVPDRPEMPHELAERYPLRFPMNPHMRSEASRLQTFDRRWPMHKTRVQPQDIAEAGFFFLGERDRVKCWYCNGGLQNWEYDDIPWVEHSKWFPNCQFLLAKQGQLFVYRHLSLSPHLPRPIIGRQDGATVDPSTATPHSNQSARTPDVPPSRARARAPSPPPAIIDPQEELRKRRERVDKEMQSDTIKVVVTMGYEENLVRRTLIDQLESGNPHDAENIFDGVASLLDAVLKKEEENRQEEEADRDTSIKFPSVSSNYSALTVGSMDTSPSSGQGSGLCNVSGFDSDEEERDLYSSIKERPSVGGVSVCAGGSATNGPISVGRETRPRPHIWDDVPDDPESIKEFIEQKKEERLCKICFTETADMVFIPCSHMCCCKTCTEAIRNCPICRKKIEKAIKTYVK